MTLIEEDPITMRPRGDGSTSGSIGTREALTGTILRQQQAAAVRRIEQQAEQRAEYVEKRNLRDWIAKSRRPKGKIAAPSQKATEISAISMEKKTGRPRGQNLLENVSRVEQKKLQEWAESEQARSVEETIGIAEGQQAQYKWQMVELSVLQMQQRREALQAEIEASAKRSEEFRTAKAYGYDSYEELQRAIREEKAIKRANELGRALAEIEQITLTIAREGYAGAAAEYGRDPGGMLAQQTAIVTAAQESISKNFSDVITVDAKGYQGYLQEASSYAGKVKDLESRPAETMTVQAQSVPKGWIGGTESSRVLAMQQQADETAGRALGRLGEVAASVRQTLIPTLSGKQKVPESATIFVQEAPAVRKLNREDLITYPVAKGTDISLEYLGNEFTRWKLAGDEGIRRTVSRPMESLPEPVKVVARGMIPGFDTIPERLRNLKDMGIGIGKLVTMGGMSSAYVVPSLEWAVREPEAYAAVIGPATVLSFEQMAEEAQREPWEAAGAAMFMIAGPKASPIKYQRYSVPTGKTVTVPKWGKVIGPLTEVPEVVTYRGLSIESPHHTILKGGGFEPDWAGFETGTARHIGGITTKGPKPRAGLEIQMGKGKQLFETFKESTVYQIQSDVMAQRYALRLKPEERPAFISLYELSKDVRRAPVDLIELHEPTLASSGAIRDPSGRVVADPKALKTAMIETDQVLYGSSLHEVMFGKAETPGRTARFAGDIETMPIGRSESAAKHGIIEMAKAYLRGEVKRKGGKFPSYEIEVGGEALGGVHWGEYPFRVTKRGDRYIEVVDPSHPKHLSQRRTLLPKPGEDVPIVKVPQSSRDIIQLESGLLIESPKIQFLRKLESMTGIDVEAGTFGARSARLGKDLFDIGEYVTLYEQSALKTYQKTGKPEYLQQAKQYRERWDTVMENPRMKAAYEEFTADFMKTYPKQKAAAVALERQYGAPAPTTGRPFSEVVALDPWKLGADFLPGEVKASVGVPKHLEWVVKREGFVPQSDAPITIPLMQRVLRESGRGEALAIFSAELKAMREFTKPTKPPVVRDPYEVITEVERLPEGRETRQQLLDLIKNVAPEAEIGGSFGMAIQSRKGKSGIPQDIDLSVADPLAVSKALKEQYFDIHLKPTETRVSGHGGIERHNPQSGEWYHAMDIHGLDKRPLFGEMDIGRYGLTVGGPITVKGLQIKPFKELALRKISNIAAMSREQIGTKTVKTETLSPSKLAIKDGMMVETGRVPKVVEKEVPIYEYFTAPEKHRGKDIADSLMALESHTKALSESIIEPAYIPKQVRLEDIRTDIGKVLKEGHLPVSKSGGKVYDQRAQALERMKSVHPENPLGIETVTKDILIDMGTEFRTGKTTVVKPESRFFRLPGTSRYFENPFAMQTHVVRKGISDIVSGRRELPIGFAVKIVKPEEAFWHTPEIENIRVGIRKGDNEWGFLQDVGTRKITYKVEGEATSVYIPVSKRLSNLRDVHTHPRGLPEEVLFSISDVGTSAALARVSGSIVVSPTSSAFIRFKRKGYLAEMAKTEWKDVSPVDISDVVRNVGGKIFKRTETRTVDNLLRKKVLDEGLTPQQAIDSVNQQSLHIKKEIAIEALDTLTELLGADIYYTEFPMREKTISTPKESAPAKAKPTKVSVEIPEFRIKPTKARQKQKPQAKPSYPPASAPKGSIPKSYTIPLSEKIYNISQRSKSPEGSKESYIPRSRFTAKFTYRPEHRPSKMTYKIDSKPPEYRPSEYKIDYKPPGYKPSVYKPPGYIFTSRIHPPPPPPPPPPPRLPWGGKDKKRTKKVRHSIFGALEMQHNIKLWDEVLFGTSKKPMKERTSPFLTVMTGNRQFTIPKTQLGATKKRLKTEKKRIEAIQF